MRNGRQPHVARFLIFVLGLFSLVLLPGHGGHHAGPQVRPAAGGTASAQAAAQHRHAKRPEVSPAAAAQVHAGAVVPGHGAALPPADARPGPPHARAWPAPATDARPQPDPLLPVPRGRAPPSATAL